MTGCSVSGHFVAGPRTDMTCRSTRPGELQQCSGSGLPWPTPELTVTGSFRSSKGPDNRETSDRSQGTADIGRCSRAMMKSRVQQLKGHWRHPASRTDRMSAGQPPNSRCRPFAAVRHRPGKVSSAAGAERETGIPRSSGRWPMPASGGASRAPMKRNSRRCASVDRGGSSKDFVEVVSFNGLPPRFRVRHSGWAGQGEQQAALRELTVRFQRDPRGLGRVGAELLLRHLQEGTWDRGRGRRTVELPA